MKKILLLSILLFPVLMGHTQDINSSKAMQLVARNKTAIGLSDKDLGNAIVSDAYYNQTSGTQLVYLQQSYKGLPVFNQIKTLAFKNDLLVSVAGTSIKSIEKITRHVEATPAISAEVAVKKAISDKKLTIIQPLKSTLLNGSQKLDFGKSGISNEKITAELMWVSLNDGKELKLAWQVYLVPSNSADYWLINVDANNNEILGEINLTVYCNFDGDKNQQHQNDCNNQTHQKEAIKNAILSKPSGFSPAIVNGASYRIIPFPAESPNHPGGAPDIRTNPWTLAPGNATSLKWHSNGTTDYTITRGNNVLAAEDRDGSNATPGQPANSSTSPDPLTFDFVPDFTVAPTQTTPVQNQPFNITNLFYWNNIIHDLVYQYGFDEVSGNFQSNNQGRGGAGNDHVIADAQDGGGTNNANFATPADGGSGRMQMYLWNSTPQKDGDVDNGIIVHEFGHGISNRLAGGPSQAGCVSNAEQMGEGWSDYYALMATQDWGNSLLTDGFNKPRGIGTYATGQSPSGAGIRSQRYCTNFAINNKVYATSIPGTNQQHSRGELWCATLWDMTWNIINQAGSINPNIFDASGAGGNSIALKLVTEGLKLQACNSGFIDGRNGILQADQILYAGAYRCAIMQAFARRGMGFDASQGSANSTTDQVPGFSITEGILTLTQSVAQQLETLNVTYNNRVSAGACGGLSNYLLTDTLPTNVTYVSGGSYNAATRVVSFAVNLAAGQSQDYPFTVQVNNGSWFPSVNLLNEQVLTSTIPSSWSAASTNTTNFVVSATQSQSTPFAFFGINATNISDFSIATNTPIAMGAAPPTLSFWHNYNTEDGWDGGVVEISTNNGATWSDLGPYMIQNGYNGSMGTGSNNPIGGRDAFTGNSNGFIKTTVSLLSYPNQNALFRFRAASDDNTANIGWYIDDILLQSKAVVNIRSNLFNQAGTRVNVKDTVTVILENAICNNGVIGTQPASITSCSGSNISFVVNATGTALSYQWQQSTNAGISYNNISGATSATLNLTAINAALNGNKYRVIINGTCTVALVSDAATLTVSEPTVINTQPAGATGCAGSSVNFNVQAAGPSLSYQWQVSTGAAAFANITNGTVYSGANTATLSLSGITASLNGNTYRVIISGFSCAAVTSAAAVLNVNPLPVAIINGPDYINITPAQPLTLTTSISPSGNYTYQWYRNNTNLTGVTGASYPVDVDRLGIYSVMVTDANGCSAVSNLVTVADTTSKILFIYPNPNNGQFQVRYFNANNNNEVRTINVYDAKAARIYSKQYNVSSGYQRMNVILTNVQSGVYMVDLRDSKGKRLASGAVIIQ